MFVVFALTRPNRRGLLTSVGSVLRSALSPGIVIPLAMYFSWMLTVVRGAFEIGIWTADLWKPTLLWIGLSGLGVVFKLSDAISKEHHFRHALVEALGLALLVEFVVTLRSFPLWLEIPAQFLAVLAAMMVVVTERRRDGQPVLRVLNGYLVVFGLGVLTWSVVGLVQQWGDLDRFELLLEFLSPVWLTLAALAFLYVFAVVAAFQSDFTRMRIWVRNGPLWRQRLGLLLRCNVRLDPHRALAGGRLSSVAGAARIRDAWRETGEAIDEAGSQRAEERAAAQRLIDNAGSTDTDGGGRRYDRREYKETCDALRFLHISHAGHHRHGDRYRAELFDVLSGGLVSHGLPDDHGIQCHVSLDGRRWYALRQTITGWWFGIGARTAPPDVWLYDGATPPSGYPNDQEWDRFGAGDHSLNWE